MNGIQWIAAMWPPSPELLVRLTLTLLHFLWLGGVVAVTAAIVGRLLRKSSSHARYTVYVGALLVMAASLPLTFALVSVPRRPVVVSAAHTAEAKENPAARIDVAPEVPHPVARDEALPTASPTSSDSPARAVAPTFRVDNRPAVPTPSLLERCAPLVTLAYLLGVLLMLARLTLSVYGGRRLRRSAQPVEDVGLLAMAARQAERLGLAVVPAIAWCERIAAPAVVGIVKPIILLPTSLASGLDPQHLESLLAHELAHVRRFDLLVNLLQRLIEAVLFFHPAVWYVSRCVSSERENACDDLVLSAGWPRLQYADALVRMAELCSGSQQQQFAGQAGLLAATGENATQFKRRVLRLLEVEAEPHIKLPAGGVLIALLACGVVLTAVGLFQAVAQTPPKDNPRDVTNAKDEPTKKEAIAWGETVNGLQFGLGFPGGSDKFRIGQALIFSVHARNKTDAAINLRYGFPSWWGLERSGDKIAISPMFLGGHMFKNRLTLKPGEERELPELEQRPTQHILLAPREWSGEGEPFIKLEPGEKVSLVSSAAVLVEPELDTDWRGKAATDSLAFEVTASDGPWRQEDAAAWREPIGFPVDSWRAPAIPMTWNKEKLWKQLTAHLLSLTESELRPYSFAERDGKIVIEYRTCEQRVWRPGPEKKSAKGGGELVRQAENGPRSDGMRLEIWLSDEPGQAVRPQTLERDPWRVYLGEVALPELKTSLTINVSYGTRTDRKLLSRIGNPRDWLTAVLAAGEAKAQDKADVLIRASVVDAKSGEPVKAFRVVPGTPYTLVKGPDDPSPAVWQPHLLRAAANGQFDWPLERSYEQFRLRFEAEGFIPEYSKWLKKTDGFQEIAIKLRPDPGIEGRVVLPDGKPAAGAMLAITMPNRGARIENGKFAGADAPPAEKPTDQWRRPIYVKADGEGRYRLPTEPGAVMIYAIHDGGIAEVTAAALLEAKEIKLAAWGAIDGRVMWHDKPGAGEKLSLSVMREAAGYPEVCSLYLKATADNQGRFRFEKLPPWKVQLSRSFELPDKKVNYSFPYLHVEIAAGEPTKVIFGGKGRPVTGKLVGLDSYEGITLGITPNSPRPSDEIGWQAHGLIARSDIGPIFFREKLAVNKDGTFRIDNVLPAYYQLFVKSDDKSVYQVHQLLVPAPAADKLEMPHEAGEIKVARRKPNGEKGALKGAGQNGDASAVVVDTVAPVVKEAIALVAAPTGTPAEVLALLREPGSLFKQDDDGNVVSITVGGKASDEWLAKIKSLPKLKKLYIDSTKDITEKGLAHIGDIASLESLEFYSVLLPDAGVAHLTRLPRLAELSITEAKLTDSTWPHLGKLKGLRLLRLKGNQLTDAGMDHLKGLSQLEVLDLAHGNWVDSKMQISSSGIVHLAGLKKLRELNISGLQVDDDGFGRLGELKELRILNLSGTQITGRGLKPLAGYTHLESLFLAGPWIDDAGMEFVGQCEHLNHLLLSYTKVGDAGFVHLGSLAALERLSLDSRVVSDAGLAHLAPLKKLSHIELRSTKTSDEGLKHLSNLNSLSRLDLSGSGEPGVNIGRNYTGEGYAHLAKTMKLKTFYLTNADVRWTELRDLKQLQTLSMMMPTMSPDDVRELQKALPDTFVSAAWGGTSVPPRQLFDEKGIFIGPKRAAPKRVEVPGANAAPPADNLVVDVGGKPIAAAKIEILPYEVEPKTVLASTTADKEGRFDYPKETPPAAHFHVRVSAPGFVSGQWIGNHTVHLKRDGNRVPDVFQLARPVTVSGRVVGAEGKPLANVPLGFDFISGRMASINNRRFVTDAKGEFRLEGLPAGDLFVRYDRRSGVEDRVPPPIRFYAVHVPAKDGETIADVVLDFSQAKCELQGQLVDAQGTGIAQAEITVGFAVSATRLDHTVRVQTDDKGRFRIDGLPPHEFRVSASQRRGGLGEPVTVKLRPDAPTEVRLKGYTPGHAPMADRKVEPKWGREHEGLQAAIIVEPAKASYAMRDIIDVRVLVRNVGEEAKEFTDTLSFNALHIAGPDGKIQQLDFRAFSGVPWSETYRLEPGHEVELKGSFNIDLTAKTDTGGGKAMFNLTLEPGLEYGLSVTFGDGFDVGPPRDDKGVRMPKWATGATTLIMTPAAKPPAKP